MNRRALPVAALAALLVAAGAARLAVRESKPPAYAGLRQVEQQVVPGTWEIVLAPIPRDYDPKLSLEEALDTNAGRTPRDQIQKSLALVSNRIVYVSNGVRTEVTNRPSWVFVVHGLCYASDKGELVSSARRPADYEARRCTQSNISVLAVDATTGEYVLSGEGYDESATWAPATAGVASA